MPRERAYWSLVAISYPCPTCEAAPGEDCYTASGNQTRQVHAARVSNVNRCPKCGARTPADDEPGQICARCELVRSLEVERATRHERRNP